MRTSRIDKPSLRVRAAMERLSRNRWLTGKECREFAWRLSLCASWSTNGAHSVYRGAMPKECEVIGMVRGAPPAWLWEPHYKTAMRMLRHIEPGPDGLGEMQLLKFQLLKGADPWISTK